MSSSWALSCRRGATTDSPTASAIHAAQIAQDGRDGQPSQAVEHRRPPSVSGSPRRRVQIRLAFIGPAVPGDFTITDESKTAMTRNGPVGPVSQSDREVPPAGSTRWPEFGNY